MNFAIVMHRSIFVCLVFLSLLAIARSKTINPGNDEDTETIITGTRLFTILPDLSSARDESNAKLDSKKSLSVPMPMTEEKKRHGNEEAQDPVGMSQKTKRCKTSILEERVSAPMEKVNQDLLKSRNTRNSYNVRQNDDSSVEPSSRLRLVSLKNPNTAMERDPLQRSKVEEYAADRNVAILKAIREKLKLKARDDTVAVGAIRRNSVQKSGVIDDDKYVCYCKVKNNNPSSRKETLREHGMLPRKSKAEKKEDNKIVLLNENRQRQKQIYGNGPNEAYLAESLLASRDDRRYLANVPSKKPSPMGQREGIEGIPYLPYVYRIDPEYAILSDTIRTENPLTINIPFKAVAGRPDSNVGQRAPFGRGRDFHFNQNKQIIGQRPCTSNVAETLLKASRNTTPATSITSKISTENISKDNDRRDYSIEMVEKSVEKEEFANEYETSTGLDDTDYSDVKQVTRTYFEPKSGKHNIGNYESNGYSSSTETNAFVFQGFTLPVNDTTNKQLFAQDSASLLLKQNRERERIDGNDTNETTISMNTSNETTTRHKDDSGFVESRVKSLASENGDKIKNQTLPFGNDTLLRKSIKAVINKFANNDYYYSSETSENMDRETVDSTGNDLLEEIVKIPNLKGILSMPPIEHTILDKVKNLLAKLTGVARSNFDDDWTTNVIKSNLRNTMAAAAVSDAELPPMTVKERQFKNGKWITSLVTLEPTSNEEPPTATDFAKLQATVKSLVRDPAIDLRAAKQPAVRNMIVQSVQTILQPKNSTNDQLLNESVIRATLDDQLTLMEIEHAEITTTETAQQPESIDPSNIDNFHKIFTNLNIYESTSTTSVLTNTEETVEQELSDTSNITDTMQMKHVDADADADADVSKFNGEDTPATRVTSSYPKNVCFEDSEEKKLGLVTPSNYNLVGATRILKPSKFEQNEREQSVESHEAVSKPTMFNIVPARSRNQDESLRVFSTESNDAASPDEYDSTEGIPGMEINFSSSTQVYPDYGSPEHDYAYLGKMTVKKNNFTDDADVPSLRNSDLYYVGDGVKLPLEIRKLNDGSYALSISRKVCEHLLNKECPCCVPLEGNVVRAVRNNPDTNNTTADKLIETIAKRKTKRNISKRESTKASFSNEQRGRDSVVDSIHILSMPVETFAKKYNLSLSLEKVQAPWTLDAKEKITNDRNDQDNADKDLIRDLLSVHAVSGNYKSQETPVITQQKENANSYKNVDAANYEYQRQKQIKFDKFRYQRNIDETVNQRVEIVTNVLNWLRDMILTTTSDL
ncbi:uncharacterized protein LOC128896384 isoform X2 [Hylaeus anthracinus]|uniref:uncharacterized protein LOC128896384 isoform X2 n=1 Tax=Hylaeus anthracinus TaxID=313031 RepID=UPI0023B8E8F2|nr:uncharacterized protein LOC128896384 isoform X2 [Hylaeus anthracinus]